LKHQGRVFSKLEAQKGLAASNALLPKEEEWEQGMWIERATVGELSTRPLGANPEPPSTTAEQKIPSCRA